MENARVLITGGAGFIGSTLANALAERNDVIALDDCSLGTAANLDDRVEFVDGDVLDADLPTRGVDALVHLAARSSRNMHEADPQDGARVNVEGFVNAVEQARRAGCTTVVYASTSSVYGSHTAPASESRDVEARTAYEASKLARERYATYFATHHGLDIVGLRLFSVYDGFGGNEAHKGTYANTVSQFAHEMATGASPVVYEDGTQTRDFVHVDDVISAIERAADARLTGVYNVGTGVSHSFNEVIGLLNDSLGTAIEPEYVPCPFEGYIRHTVADPTRFVEATGWRPEIDFEEGIERVCRPYR
ncbi:NAD-dependent epimerase/dehydratase family protein [Haloferacaceae archaeon DSL9]